MVCWYRDLYMDETVRKNPKKCKKRVEKRRPWKKNYYAVTLASNPENLFDIIGTREMFFRRYAYMDVFVVGLAASKGEAVKLLQEILEEMNRKNVWNTAHFFRKKDFVRRKKKQKK
ncbi:MAG: hypothetical protein J5988_06820 [Eubacterium sp.]|nr:hypothetical protein [Eubacterium sp.]